MNINLNFVAFILTFVCIILFFIGISSAKLVTAFIEFMGIHPLVIVLGITLVVLVLGMAGLKDVKEWKAMVRSMITILFTAILSAVLFLILFFGGLLG